MKWKMGEYTATGNIKQRWLDSVIPIFKLLPAGTYDNEDRTVHSAADHIKKFGTRLGQHWGGRLAFIDAKLLDDEHQRSQFDVHPLTAIVGQASFAGANVSPVVELTSSLDYLTAAKKCLKHNGDRPVCLRITLDNLSEGRSFKQLSDFVIDLGRSTKSTVLLIDGGPIEVTDYAGFAQLLANSISELCPKGAWGTVVWSCTSFPEKIQISPGGTGKYVRHDWNLYKEIVKMANQFSVLPIYSDYAVDYPGNYKPARAKASAQIRYSDKENYLVFKGKRVDKPLWNAEIRPVLASLESSGILQAPSFSVGDQYLHYLINNPAKNGTPSMWRSAATSHHFALVLNELDAIFGRTWSEEESSVRAVQLSLV